MSQAPSEKLKIIKPLKNKENRSISNLNIDFHFKIHNLESLL